MHRRAFLTGAAGTTATALAGCSTIGIGGGSGGPSDPTAPVESIAAASAANDTAAVEAAAHPDGPLAEGLPRSVEDRTLSIENATIASETNGTAVVEANVSVTETGEQWHEPREFEVREREGEWTLWSMATGPELALREYVAAVDADDAEAARAKLTSERYWGRESVVDATSLSLQATRVEEYDSHEAIVVATVVETVDGTDTDREATATIPRRDGDWKVESLPAGPILPIYQLTRAITENDREGAAAAFHPESSLSLGSVISDTEGVSASTFGPRLDEPPEDGEARIRTTVELSPTDSDRTTILLSHFEVRIHDGRWRIYDWSIGMGGEDS